MKKGRPNQDFRYYEPPKEAWKTSTDRFFGKSTTPNFYPQHRNTNITVKEGQSNPAVFRYDNSYLKGKTTFPRTKDHRDANVLTVV